MSSSWTNRSSSVEGLDIAAQRASSLPVLPAVPTARQALDDVNMFVRLTSRFADEFISQLVQSVRTFWPQASRPSVQHDKCALPPLQMQSFMVVLDDESPADHNLGAQLNHSLQAWNFPAQIRYERPEQYYGDRGHNRQQWSMFWADRHVSGKFVAFVDSDTIFTTQIHAGDLFDDVGRPRIIANVGAPQNSFWHDAPAATALALGKPEVLRCMSYFPVILKTQHLAALREHISSTLGGDFDTVFQRHIVTRTYSQFNIMCNYAWYFHKDEYSWHMQEREPGWRGEVPGQITSADLDSLLRTHSKEAAPFPRVSIHWGYVEPDILQRGIVSVVREGVCRSACAQLQAVASRQQNGSLATCILQSGACALGTERPSVCDYCASEDQTTMASLHRLLFEFESARWYSGANYLDAALQAQATHYAGIAAAPQHEWITSEFTSCQ
ncbi:MAG: hypothetical protein EOO65_04255 [Methanosarcinales archaeon]|nr:MAG: hypothetical protein EOO65_04255 [Methanosarcinales archaeon]